MNKEPLRISRPPFLRPACPKPGTPSPPLPDKARLVSPTLRPPLRPQGTWMAASRGSLPDAPHTQPITALPTSQQSPRSRKQRF